MVDFQLARITLVAHGKLRESMSPNKQWVPFVASFWLGICSAAAAPVLVTTQPSYYPGERLDIQITYTAPAVLTFYELPQTTYVLDNVYSPGGGGAQVVTQVVTPHTWTNRHSW